MNNLSKKQSKLYDYISRYSGIPFYYNEADNKYISGITEQLRNTTSYIYHNIQQTDTLDSLALKYYGRPDFFWVIADFNRIQDPFINLKDLPYRQIKIPSITAINFTFDLRA